jgi:hypothetical protein
MFSFTVRLGGGNYANSGSSVFLDRPDGPSIQLHHCIENFARLRGTIDPLALDFVLFALVVYGCDRASSRAQSADQWTRQFELTMPVSTPEAWNGAVEIAQEMVSFLTGDEWQIHFVPQSKAILGNDFLRARRTFRQRAKVSGQVVSLFSGGMDSLIGAIDWLESNPGESITLCGAYDPAAEPAAADQRALLEHLRTAYPKRIHHIIARMGIEGKGVENSYRSRSFCFVSFGILAARFLAGGAMLVVPENGSIALNFPLTPARSGSLSTRTVHPYFLDRMRALLAALGLDCPVTDPYRFRTKGEMIKACLNPALLRMAHPDAISCGNRKRYKAHVPGATADHCGYCVPCIFRKAALHAAGWPLGDYGVDISRRETWGKLDLTDPNLSVEAAKDFVRRADGERVIWNTIRANGRVPAADKNDYIELVKRQRAELAAYFVHIGILSR